MTRKVAFTLLAWLCMVVAAFIVYLAYPTAIASFEQRPGAQAEMLRYLLAVLVCCGSAVMFREIALGRSRRSTAHGSARWARLRELAHVGIGSPPKDGVGWLELGRIGRKTIALSPKIQLEHIILIAPNGKGKSAGVIIPGLLQEKGTRGLFVNDVKGELYNLCAGSLSTHMKVQRFAPTDAAQSICYNPLAHVQSVEDAEDLARAWIENTGQANEFYSDTARLLMTAVIMHLHDQEPEAPLSRLADILTGTLDQIKTILNTTKSATARSIGTAFINTIAMDKERASAILTGMHARFLILKNPTIRKLTAGNDVSIPALVDGPGALFLSIPASDARRLKPLTAVLTMQLFTFMVRRRQAHFAFYLDELCNAGKIPHYAEHISLVRGQGIALIQAIQDFGQLRREYGRDDASTILANSNTKVFFSGLGKEEAEYCSQLLGYRTEVVRSYGQSSSSSAGAGARSGKSNTTTTSEVRRELMTPDEIRQLPVGEMIIVASNVPPVQVQSHPYYHRDDLVARTKLVVS